MDRTPGARRAVFSGGTALAIIADGAQDWINYETGVYDRYQFGGALLADTIANIAVSAASGYVAGVVTAGATTAIANGVLGAALVASAPAIGLAVGAVAAVGTAIVLKSAYDNYARVPVRDAIANFFSP